MVENKSENLEILKKAKVLFPSLLFFYFSLPVSRDTCWETTKYASKSKGSKRQATKPVFKPEESMNCEERYRSSEQKYKGANDVSRLYPAG
ncbi:hypothetical protein KFK09_004761 [Dendrobium nobile]|uniref:Uncharacterized protein n=1 Tax=Dendrobium nobile TaxID=94219 RepID=A0A8T3BWA7_DENNO|nr:hypothetical protein KFK09_004761 [Dendrobium nobile]